MANEGTAIQVENSSEELQSSLIQKTIAVGICVITYQRPQGLCGCLQSLQLLQFSRNPQPDISIFVVDNDPNASAQPIVQQLQPCSKWPITYSIEPTRGISYARNHAVALAKHCDFIAFIDDDEYADPSWLDELLYTQRLYNADVVAGKVLPEFESQPPSWVLDSGLFEKKLAEDGGKLEVAHTSNVLIRKDLLDWVEGPFDPRFALTGGSDTMLFRTLSRLGANMIWSDRSVVWETIPPSRSNFGWVMRRAYRVGNTKIRCEKALPPELRRSLIGLIMRAVLSILQESIKLLPSLVLQGKTRAIMRLKWIATSLGMIAACFGISYEEYRRVHGS